MTCPGKEGPDDFIEMLMDSSGTRLFSM